MSQTIAVVATGAMGAAVGARLVAGGARVLTSTAGRTAGSVARARAANMAEATDEELAAADLFLSIVPPNRAVELAIRLVAAGRPATYVDLNAISPRTAERVASVVTAAGATFVDGGIVGGPPAGDSAGPTVYLSGPAAAAAETMTRHGLTVRVLDGGIGAASALKLAYAGLNKGMIALGSAMILAATRAGVGGDLRAELAASLPEVSARLARGVPNMLPKAYRWGPEMREIADFLGDDRAEARLYRAMADLYDQIAVDREAGGEMTALMQTYFEPS